MFEDRGELELERFPINKVLPCTHYRVVAFSEIGIFYVDDDTGQLEAVVFNKNKELVFYGDLFGKWLSSNDEVSNFIDDEHSDIKIIGIWFIDSCLYLWFSYTLLESDIRRNKLLAAYVNVKKLGCGEVRFEIISWNDLFTEEYEYIKLDGNLLYGITKENG